MDANILILGALFYTLAFIASVTLLYFCVDSRRSDSFLAKTLLAFQCGVKLLVPRCIQQCFSNTTHFIFYTRNSCIQYLYATLLTAGFTAYTVTAFSYVSKTFWGQFPFYTLVMNLGFFVACSCKDPGVITASNLTSYLQEYEFDGNMYSPRECSTCKQKKPARSKHCALCNVCIARFDHHCSWVNNCIGKQNYKYFMGFLLSLVAMTGESAFMVSMVFLHIAFRKNLHASQFVDDQGHLYEASLGTVIQYLCNEYPLMAFLLVFLFMLFLVLGGFFLFHCYLLVTNQTTNELMAKKPKPKALNEKGNTRQSLKQNRATVTKKSRSKTPSLSSKHSRKSYIFGWYSRGIFENVREVLRG